MKKREKLLKQIFIQIGLKLMKNSNELSKVKDKQFDFLGLSVTGGLMIGPGMIIKHSALEAIGFVMNL